MVNDYKCIFNVTYAEKNAILRCQFPEGTSYTLPQISFLNRELEKIRDEILKIEGYVPRAKRIIISDEGGDEGDFGKIIPKKTLSRLCNMLNKKKKNITFKLAT